MTLSQSQRRFAYAVALLVLEAERQGLEVTLGDAYRDPRLHGEFGVKRGYGSAKSNHKRRLAVDLNLFRAGRYLTATESHRPLGEFWEELGEELGLPLRWGGRFDDGNHYELNPG